MEKKHLIFIISCVLLLSGCSEKKEAMTIQVEDNGLQFGQSVTRESQESTTVSTTRRRLPRPGTVKESNIYETSETINVDGIEFSNLNYSINKNLLDKISKDDVTYFKEIFDDNGTLIDNSTYVFIKLTIKNTTEKSEELYLSMGSLVELDQSGFITDSSSELRYRSGYDSNNVTKKDYNRTILDAGESEDFVLGFIINEEFSKTERLYYMINNDGNTSGSNLKAFKLK